MSEDDSCMFYATELYVENTQEKSPGNYSLNYDRSECRTTSLIGDGANSSSAMYVFRKQTFKQRKNELIFYFQFGIVLGKWTGYYQYDV